MELFGNISIGWKLWTIFAQSSVFHLWLSSECASEISKIKCNLKVRVTLYRKVQEMVNTYAKVKCKYCKKGLLSFKKHAEIDLAIQLKQLFWNIPKSSCSKIFRKTYMEQTTLLQVHSLQPGTLSKTNSIPDLFLFLKTPVLPLGQLWAAPC